MPKRANNSERTGHKKNTSTNKMMVNCTLPQFGNSITDR